MGPVADVLPVPPDFVPPVMAAPAFVLATPVFLPAADDCESSAGESASSSPFVETDVVDAFRLSALALPPAFLFAGGVAEVPSDQYSSSVETSEKSEQGDV